MKAYRVIAAGAGALLGMLLGAGLTLAAESTGAEWKKNLPFELTGEVEGGLQVVQPRGNSATFDEYRDLDRTDRDGWGHLFQVPSLRLLGEDKARTRFLEIGGTNLTRMDANYYMNAGMYNYLRFNFEFDRIPHVISHTAQTIYNEGPEGVFRIPAGAAATTLATQLNAASPVRANVVSAVNALAHPTELGFQTDAARMGLSWLPLPELELSVGYSHTTRDGHVPWGVLIGSPGSNVVELAGTRDETFHEVKAGAEYVRDWFQLRFNYTFSLFENDVNKLEWDNPCGGGTGGCTNPSGLGRFSTMPENFAHTFSGAAGFNLPWWRTRLTGGFSYAQWRQDETFLPYTTVTGFTGNTTDAGASSPDARINVVHANANLTTRPLRNVTLTSRYRYYELENHTPEHTFTNVVSGLSTKGLSPGDTTPGATTTTLLTTGPTVHSNEPIAFRKQNASQDIAWRIIPQVTAKAGYEWEHWNRKDREAASTNEHILKGAVDVRPWTWLLGRLGYAHSVRTVGADGYDPLGGNEESLPQFRKFDEADRTRDKGDILLQISPLDTLTLSGSFYAQHDNYFNSSFGLHGAKAYGWSADVSWAPIEQVSVFVGYANDEYRSNEQSCFISLTPSATPPTPTPAGALPGTYCVNTNVFSVRPRDVLDTVSAGINVTVIPKLFDVSLGYRFAFGRSKQQTAGVAGGSASGDPASVPTAENKFHVFNVVGRYFLTPQWSLKLGYQYERYTEQDFTTDGIGPALASNPESTATADLRSIILGAQHPNYEAHIVAFTVGYRF